MYTQKIVTAGRTKEVYRYYTIRTPPPYSTKESMRQVKENPTPERVAKANMRRRADHLRHLMNTNFNPDDYSSVTLTYRKDEARGSIREARDDVANFIRKVRRAAKGRGIELKYIYVIGVGNKTLKPTEKEVEKRDGLHIHITLNAPMDIVEGCWTTHGYIKPTPLYGNDQSNCQYRNLASYYMDNAISTREREIERGERPGQMYICSKNLKQPTIRREVISAREFRTDPKPQRGYFIEKDSVYIGFTMSGYPILEYTLIEVGTRYMRHREPREGGG